MLPRGLFKGTFVDVDPGRVRHYPRARPRPGAGPTVTGVLMCPYQPSFIDNVPRIPEPSRNQPRLASAPIRVP